MLLLHVATSAMIAISAYTAQRVFSERVIHVLPYGVNRRQRVLVNVCEKLCFGRKTFSEAYYSLLGSLSNI